MKSIEILLPEMLRYSQCTGLVCPLLPMQKLWVDIAFIEHRSFHAVHQRSRWFLASSYVLHSSRGNTVMSAYDDLENELVLLLYFLFLSSMNSGRRTPCEERRFKNQLQTITNNDDFIQAHCVDQLLDNKTFLCHTDNPPGFIWRLAGAKHCWCIITSPQNNLEWMPVLFYTACQRWPWWSVMQPTGIIK